MMVNEWHVMYVFAVLYTVAKVPENKTLVAMPRARALELDIVAQGGAVITNFISLVNRADGSLTGLLS